MYNQQFIKLLKDGDEDAYARLFKVTYPRLISYCKLFVIDANKADDLVQECYVKFWDQRKKINTSKSVESLLFVMLRNQCLNYLRDERLNAQSLKLDDDEWSEIQHLYQIDFLGYEEASMEQQLAQAIQRAIDELPEKRKEVFIRCKIEGEKQRVVAEELGVSVKAVEKHISLAKAELSEKLKAQFPTLSVIIAFILS
ncbi:sigma-70 family RNA polymerase sigma factor [Puteibacter caeruleilacunae]|nr:sigma-70 family RNA polymerase sigma factor [Puteibacter caeruleilacunae]